MKPKNKIVVVLGTRPEIIKTSALLRILRSGKTPYRLIHTGQHYSYSMDRLFFKQLGLPNPQYQLDQRSKPQESRRHYVARMSRAIQSILAREAPCTVLVQGDTNSVLAGALASRRVTGVRLGHIEAGLRSYDLSMPEELNRIETDRISDWLFAPTLGAKKILFGEGLAASKIFITGNTIVDAVLQALPIAKKKIKLSRWGVSSGRYFLLTLHRQENVDFKPRLASILKGVDIAARRWGKPVLFPVHPRTAARLKQFGLVLPECVRPVEPVGFLEFLRLEASAALVLTDSGGVQEEACILKVPCVTLRTSTERPETVAAGGNVIAGYRASSILAAAKKMMRRKRSWKNPFGDGRSSRRILKIIEEGRA